jgi:4,5-DOPA dioxygenase extradiol
VLLMGSGNVVHNLRAIDWKQPDAGFDWARRFDEHARQVMTERPGDAAGLVAHRDYAMSAPTPDHFLPVLYIAGAAAAAGAPAQVLVDGYAYGSLSMTSYGVGCSCPESADGLGGSAPLSKDVPADESNV